jgi:hypothetical protein
MGCVRWVVEGEVGGVRCPLLAWSVLVGGKKWEEVEVLHCAIKKHHYSAHEKEAAWSCQSSVRGVALGLEGAYLPPEQKATPISIHAISSCS